ncbi:adenine nucleotide alpha hydrolases-like protein [Lophiostoma macrostomum CBS 122681]|uniref:Diphthine--ammonia ligase n=1 Tax=Lophiostoma macrostomum CBS 122681 TaxID=1314788 RepID=A0A6A6SHT5_9PLEO|nr:adenine nucleotide alpha hydrolases-like protein [Lophiostoma macrostomum CBS 122681]
MATGLRVVALISGGKDSFYSILHYVAAGHSVVALANLHPPSTPNHDSAEEEEEDLNSYMYQTVGHSIIPLYAEALGIPLFRQEISGSAVNTSRDYAAPKRDEDQGVEGREEDETESLVPLLRKVLDAGLGVNAVSTGAILSTYQRTRVESVALRLGLTPLSYLWQYPNLPPYSQSGLLHDMAAVGQNARIIKVASGGLDELFLWENVADPKTIARLGRAMARFGGNGDGAVLGEGGEFETLAIDGPAVLWKRRIEVESDGVIRGDGGTYSFKSKGAKVIAKKPGETQGLDSLRIPELWDDEFKKVFDDVSTMSFPPLDNSPVPFDATIHDPFSAFSTHATNSISTSTSTIIALSNLTSTTSEPSPPTTQLTSILSTLTSLLSTANLTPAHILHTTLLLRHMSDFTSLNPIYGSIFTTPNPPSRVTIACGSSMPSDVDVMLSVLISKDIQHRDGLHVQSRSYWAPANIGPYSQAISIPISVLPNSDPEGDAEVEGAGDVNIVSDSGSDPQTVYIAGQIPLIPSTMSVPDSASFGFAGQAVLALQHLWRIGRARDVCWWTAGVAYISSSSSASPTETGLSSKVHTAQTAWNAIHTHYLSLNPSSSSSSSSPSSDAETNDIDPWDALNLPSTSTLNPSLSDTTHRAPLPNPSALLCRDSDSNSNLEKRGIAPPCYVVQVEALPRAVDIEWCSTGLARCQVSTSTDGDGDGNGDVHVISVSGTRTSFFSLEISGGEDMENVKSRLEDSLGEDVVWEHATLYATPGLPSEYCSVVGGLQWVPCKRVWGEGGKEVVGVLVGRCSVKAP